MSSEPETYTDVVRRIHGDQPEDVPASLLCVRRGPVRRRTPPRLRVFFLRQYRACGEVSLAARRTGVALSTLYRWRERDAAFRMHWERIAEQRRQIAEDRMMSLVREGELMTVYYQGKEVGWRRIHTHRTAMRALHYFDRRAANGDSVSRSAAPDSPEKPEGSDA